MNDIEKRAIVRALTPPEGYVLVPARPTKQMRAVWAAMLAARPGVP